MENRKIEDELERPQFSNAILDGYLRYIEGIEGGKKCEQFIRKVNALGLQESWLRDKKQWHSADLHGKLLGAFKEVIPEKENAIYESAYSLYADIKAQRFTSIAGLLLKPSIVFSKLASVAERMNTYNTYEFHCEKRGIGYTRARLIQKYPNLKNLDLNSDLCEASRGSFFGLMKFLGYKILDFHEDKCVRKGHSHCEYVFTWIDRPFFLELSIFSLTVGAMVLVTSVFNWNWDIRLSFSFLAATASSSLFAIYQYRKRFGHIFQYQQEALTDQRLSSDMNIKLNRRLMEYQTQINEVIRAVGIAEHSFSVFHDMASPLFVLSESIGDLSERLQSKEQVADQDSKSALELCDTIEKATDNLIVLLKVFRRASGADFNSVKSVVNIREILKNCVEMFTVLCRHNNIQLTFEAPENQVMVPILAGSIESISINLLQNAIKALRSHEGRRQIQVVLRETNENVILTVRDTGSGIPQDKLANVWVKKKHSASIAQSEDHFAIGMGFGLPYIKGLVERNSGEISLKSGSMGTEFNVTFPKSEEHSRPAPGSER